ALKQVSRAVTQVVERSAQRPTPFLVPAGASGVAAAIAAPAFYAMGAAPGGILDDLDFVRGRKLFQKLSIVGQAHMGLRLNGMESIGQGHVPIARMRAIGLPI